VFLSLVRFQLLFPVLWQQVRTAHGENDDGFRDDRDGTYYNRYNLRGSVCRYDDAGADDDRDADSSGQRMLEKKIGKEQLQKVPKTKVFS
jgi:hypothetical protein